MCCTFATLVIVDGHNLLWRAAYGFPARIVDPKGCDITGVFGFFALLRAGVNQLQEADACVVCFDGQKGGEARQNVVETYKQNRANLDMGPIEALPDIKRGLDLFGIPWVEFETEEADDLIASLASQAEHKRKIIMSTDRDLYQLVDTDTCILNTAKAPESRLIDAKAVEKTSGVTPAQWCDYVALVGDKSDEIPGIKGVGGKTAAKLLRYGFGLEDLFSSGRLTGTLGERIVNARDQLLLNRSIIRLKSTVDLSDFARAKMDRLLPKAGQVVEEMGFYDAQ